MLLFQMIFRKVSDVKKERELAERRKDDPALNQTQDHLVRKLFSKFKKTNTSNDLTCLLPDLERGPEGGNTTPRGSTLLLSPTKGRPHTRALSTYPHAQCPRAQVPTCPHAHVPCYTLQFG